MESNENNSVIFPIYSNLTYDDWIDHPRILKVPISPELMTGQFKTGSSLQDDILRLVLPDDPESLQFDFIMTPKPRIAPQIQALLGRVTAGSPAVIMSLCSFITPPDQPYYSGINHIYDEIYFYGLMQSYAAYQSEFSFQYMVERARKVFKPGNIRRLYDNRLPDYQGVDVNRVLGVIDGIEKPKNHPLRIQYAGRLTSSMRVEEFRETVQSLFEFGRDVELVICSQGMPGQYGKKQLGILDDRGMAYELHTQCPQEEFWKISATCHIQIYSSKYGEASIAASTAEQIIAGVVPIILEAPYTQRWWQDYPFSFKTKSELEVHLRYIYEHYFEDEVQGPFNELRERMIKGYDVVVRHQMLMNSIKPLVEKNRETTIAAASYVSSIVADALLASGMPEQITWDELVDVAKRTSKTGADIRQGTQLFMRTTKLDYHKTMGFMGYEGTYDENRVLTYRRLDFDFPIAKYMSKSESVPAVEDEEE